MTKMVLVLILVFISIACFGGTEDADGTQPIPSPLGVIMAMSFALLLLYNIIQHDRNRRK